MYKKVCVNRLENSPKQIITKVHLTDKRPAFNSTVDNRIFTSKEQNKRHVIAWDLMKMALRKRIKALTISEAFLWFVRPQSWANGKVPAEVKKTASLRKSVDRTEKFCDIWLKRMFNNLGNLYAGDANINLKKGRQFVIKRHQIKKLLKRDTGFQWQDIESITCYERRAPEFEMEILLEVFGQGVNDKRTYSHILKLRIDDIENFPKGYVNNKGILSSKINDRTFFDIGHFKILSEETQRLRLRLRKNSRTTELNVGAVYVERGKLYVVSRSFSLGNALISEALRLSKINRMEFLKNQNEISICIAPKFFDRTRILKPILEEMKKLKSGAIKIGSNFHNQLVKELLSLLIDPPALAKNTVTQIQENLDYCLIQYIYKAASTIQLEFPFRNKEGQLSYRKMSLIEAALRPKNRYLTADINQHIAKHVNSNKLIFI